MIPHRIKENRNSTEKIIPLIRLSLKNHRNTNLCVHCIVLFIEHKYNANENH